MTAVALSIFSFFVYAFIGWVGEGLYVRATEGKWVDRSFVNAPFFLLYGVGAIGPVLLFSATDSPWLVLGVSLFYAAAVEYIGSVAMEKIGLSYWDYSKNRWNLHGRICFESITIFLIGICLAVYYVQPALTASFAAIASPPVLIAVFVLAFYVCANLAVRIVRQYRYYKTVGHIMNYAYDRKPTRA